MSEERIAPEGAIWVCMGCGKTARDLYGIEGEHSYGWDESCVLNAVLCDEASIQRDATGRITFVVALKDMEGQR